MSTGIVSDYIKRYLESEEARQYRSWANLKENLTIRFSPIVDRPYAFVMLVNTRQRRDEDVQFYGERLLSLAEKAYPEQDDHIKPIIEAQLLSIFLSGIWDRDVRAQIERVGPKTFDEAYKLALREQQISYRCALRKNRPDRLERPMERGENTPMEVDHLRRNAFCKGRNDRQFSQRPHNTYDRYTSRDGRHSDRDYGRTYSDRQRNKEQNVNQSRSMN